MIKPYFWPLKWALEISIKTLNKALKHVFYCSQKSISSRKKQKKTQHTENKDYNLFNNQLFDRGATNTPFHFNLLQMTISISFKNVLNITDISAPISSLFTSALFPCTSYCSTPPPHPPLMSRWHHSCSSFLTALSIQTVDFIYSLWSNLSRLQDYTAGQGGTGTNPVNVNKPIP